MSKGTERVLIVGSGYVGSQVARLLSKRGIDVWCLNRNRKDLPKQFNQICGDVTDLKGLPSLNQGFDAVIYAVSPDRRTEKAYRSAYYNGLENVIKLIGHPTKFVLVSSTGIFSQNDGEWVTERTNPNPASTTAKQLLRAEKLALEYGDPGIVIRLAGIYGPGRTRMIRRIMDGGLDCPDVNYYTNRIHRDDGANSICHLLELSSPNSLYLGADSDPAPLHVLYKWLASKTGSEDPCHKSSKYSGSEELIAHKNKRCCNKQLLESGYSFIYPTFREGYESLLQNETLMIENV